MGIFSQFLKGLGFISWEVKILIYLVQSSREQRFRVCGAGPAEIVEFILRYSLLVIVIEYISIYLGPILFIYVFLKKQTGIITNIRLLWSLQAKRGLLISYNHSPPIPFISAHYSSCALLVHAYNLCQLLSSLLAGLACIQQASFGLSDKSLKGPVSEKGHVASPQNVCYTAHVQWPYYPLITQCSPKGVRQEVVFFFSEDTRSERRTWLTKKLYITFHFLGPPSMASGITLGSAS